MRIQHGGQLRLAHDQEISGVVCKANQIAEFHVPTIKYDTLKERGKEMPDGPKSRLKPSQWVFAECRDFENPANNKTSAQIRISPPVWAKVTIRKNSSQE